MPTGAESRRLSLSVVVTAYEFAALIERALRSVEVAVDALRAGSRDREPVVEVVVVDDGSTDGTDRVVSAFCSARPGWRDLLRPRAGTSNPAASRNAGVAATSGAVVAFLDGDDEYLPHHLLACVDALADPAVGFVKTGVRLSDPVHAEWKDHLERSCLASATCVRRRWHDHVGGFPDLHLFSRRWGTGGEEVRHELDVYGGREDVEYIAALRDATHGARVPTETVVHHRRPGNSFDRQYDKLSQPPGHPLPPVPQEDRYRYAVGRLLAERDRLQRADGPRG